METSKKYLTTWKGAGLLLALFLGMMLLMRLTASRVAALSGGQGIIDLTFAPSPSKVQSSLDALNSSAAKFYRFGFLAVDLVYALAYCTFYRSVIRFLLQKTSAPEHAAKLLTVLPVIGMCADLLENTVLFILLGMSKKPLLLCGTFTELNTVKFVFVYSSLLTVIGGLLCLAKKRLS